MAGVYSTQGGKNMATTITSLEAIEGDLILLAWKL